MQGVESGALYSTPHVENLLQGSRYVGQNYKKEVTEKEIHLFFSCIHHPKEMRLEELS